MLQKKVLDKREKNKHNNNMNQMLALRLHDINTAKNNGEKFSKLTTTVWFVCVLDNTRHIYKIDSKTD